MSSALSCNLLDEILIWRSTPDIPQYKETLPLIETWWKNLRGSSVLWQMYDASDSYQTSPLFSDKLQIENTRLYNYTLYWCKVGSSQLISIPVKELVVDLTLHQMEAVPDRQYLKYLNDCRYRIQLLAD